MTTLLVGLDVGTTSSKAVVFDADGVARSECSASTPWVNTPDGVELDAAALVASAVQALGEALSRAPEGPVLGLGITSMAESGVLLDRHGTPVAPLIAWHDTRDDLQVRRLATDIGADRFARRTGLPLRGQWSLTKHRWLMEKRPELQSATRRLNVAEWVVRSLGGDEVTEQSLASRTGWLDLATRTWWSETLDWSGASASLMPDLVTAGTAVGKVSDRPGLERLRGATLTVAGHDHQAATVGAGAHGAGDELDSCGTAEALVRTVPAGIAPDAVATLAADGITVGWHVLAEHWCLLAATQGGLALQRVLRLLGVGADGLAALEAEALRHTGEGLVVTGVDDATLTISGIGSTADPARLWSAALEAVTQQARTIHDAMAAVVGPHEALVATGGWTRSTAFLEAKRRILGPVTVAPVKEAGARGAALLSGVAAGVYGGVDQLPALSVREQAWGEGS
jgi:sugar (pentulose or hexulose) kinase